MSNGRTSRLVIMMLAVALACPALSWARALEPARESAWRARAWSGAARRAGEAHEVIAMHGTALVFGPGKLLKQLARALGRQHTRPAPRRNAQPRGGKANLDRIHTETHGEGSVSGTEREWGRLTAAEREFARELAEHGFHVKIIPEQRDKKTPDFLVGNTKLELKTLTNFGRTTVRKNLERAIDQGPDIIILNCRNVQAELESIKQQIRSTEHKLEISLEGKILVWMPDGSVYTYQHRHESRNKRHPDIVRG